MQSALDHVLQLSAAMHANAEQGEWIKVRELEEQRRPALEKMFSTSSSESQLRTVIQQLLVIENAITTMAEQDHASMKNTMQNLRKGKAANKAYQQSK